MYKNLVCIILGTIEKCNEIFWIICFLLYLSDALSGVTNPFSKVDHEEGLQVWRIKVHYCKSTTCPGRDRICRDWQMISLVNSSECILCILNVYTYSNSGSAGIEVNAFLIGYVKVI